MNKKKINKKRQTGMKEKISKCLQWIKSLFKARNRKKAEMAGVVFLLLILLFLAFGDGGRFRATSKMQASDSLATGSMATPSGAVAVTEKASKVQMEILQDIYREMQAGLFEAPAKIIIQNAEELEDLYVNVFGEQRHFFDGVHIYTAENLPPGKYLLIENGNTFYYGDVAGAKAQGQGHALTAYQADYGRYTYALGTWEGGHLEGEGESGNAAFGALAENTASLYAVRGHFSQDILDGEISLHIADERGESRSYIFTVYKGILVLDGKWEYNGAQKRYEIRSTEDSMQKYGVKSEEAGERRWVNKLVLE